MTEDSEAVTNDPWEDWLARSWTGYAFAAMGVVILMMGFSTLLETFGWPGTTLAGIVGGLAVLACIGLVVVSLVAKTWIRLTGKTLEVESRSRYTKFVSWSVGICILLMITSMVVPASISARRASQEATRNEFPLGDGGVVIELPGIFEIDPSVTIRHGIGMTDPGRDVSVIAYANHTADLSASTPQAYAKQLGLDLQTEIPSGRLGRMEVLSVDNTQVLRQAFTYEDSGLKFVTVVDVRQVGDWIVDVRFIASPSRLEQWTNEIEEITRSVRMASGD